MAAVRFSVSALSERVGVQKCPDFLSDVCLLDNRNAPLTLIIRVLCMTHSCPHSWCVGLCAGGETG